MQNSQTTSSRRFPGSPACRGRESQRLPSANVEHATIAASAALNGAWPKSDSHSTPTIPSWKRILDVVLIFLCLPVLLPLMLFLALLIRLVSRGPVLFKQERVGFQGRPFMCLKFRTMRVGAETGSHQGHLGQLINSNAPMVKLDAHGDNRIIPFGRILRASGLDELPQLINVLCGQMSIVGPRPCLPYECELYQPWQRERFNTLPGLTGLWQVNGKNKTTFTEMVQMDIGYSRRKSLLRDLVIILRTPVAILEQLWDAAMRRRARGKGEQPQAAASGQPGNH